MDTSLGKNINVSPLSHYGLNTTMHSETPKVHARGHLPPPRRGPGSSTSMSLRSTFNAPASKMKYVANGLTNGAMT